MSVFVLLYKNVFYCSVGLSLGNSRNSVQHSLIVLAQIALIVGSNVEIISATDLHCRYHFKNPRKRGIPEFRSKSSLAERRMSRASATLKSYTPSVLTPSLTNTTTVV